MQSTVNEQHSTNVNNCKQDMTQHQDELAIPVTHNFMMDGYGFTAFEARKYRLYRA